MNPSNAIPAEGRAYLARVVAVLYAKLRAGYTPGHPRTVALLDAIALLDGAAR